jgi:hypothetical protein
MCFIVCQHRRVSGREACELCGRETPGALMDWESYQLRIERAPLFAPRDLNNLACEFEF